MLTPLKSYSNSARISRAKHGAQGFTLIELLTVITIIGILATITFGIARGVRNTQARAKAKAELAVLSQAIEQFKSRNEDFPWVNVVDVSNEGQLQNASNSLLKTLVGWQAYDGRQVGEEDANGVEFKKASSVLDTSKFLLSQEWPNSTPEASPSLETYLVDPWGNPYVYIYKDPTSTSSWERFGYLLMSAGPDGIIDSEYLNESSGVYSSDSDFKAAEGNADNIYYGE